MSKQMLMVVDDDDDSRMMVKTILSSNGFDVIDFASGKDVLEALKTQKPDLLILDIMMPEMNGYDVVVYMKQKPELQNIPIMMLTAKADPEDLLTGYRYYGVEYYITKPFTIKQLVAGVKIVLGGTCEAGD